MIGLCRKNCLSHGIGKRLYRALFALLKLQGIRTVYGVVTVPNEKSEGLHRALGFR
ncbi:N-acetyltransferase family protein [Yeguia hominis]|uniref:GNAT family N-acetyltransferase n=1 Tax=Yeguia hominis TaxID=2763662 RepID=UPI003D2DDAA8